MLRNYLMPGFALVLLAVFAAPRPTPSVGAGIRQECWCGAAPRKPGPGCAELRTEQGAPASGQ